jgi:hypothetical protein
LEIAIFFNHFLRERKTESNNSIPLLLWIFFVFFIIIKIWLVSSQNLTALGHAAHDDLLFLNIAKELINSNWLGPYNNLTLAKGPFYPIWIATVYKSGIPLLLSQHILYAIACITFIIAIKPLLRSKLLILFIFFLLLFNPMSFTSGVMTQVLREGIYPALTIFVISFAVGLLIRSFFGLSTIFWAVGLGFALSAFWITCEEAIWVIPSILLLLIFTAIQIWRQNPKRIILLILPFIIFFATTGGVAFINKIHYGIFTISELKSSGFLSAYGALLRVKHNNWEPTIPVPKDVRESIYKVSPSFSELKPFLEGDIGGKWDVIKVIRNMMSKDPIFAQKVNRYLEDDRSGIWKKVIEDNNNNDIHGGWFLWALRDAAAASGYYTDAKKAEDYYIRLAGEINTACSKGALLCGQKRTTLMPPWHSEYINPLIKTFAWSIIFFTSFEGFDPNPDQSIGKEDSLKLFRKLTRERLETNSLTKRDILKLEILKSIGYIYKIIIPILILLTSIACIIITIQMFNKRSIFIYWVVIVSLVVAIVVRLFIFSMIHISSFPAILPYYLAPCYPLLLMFISIVFAYFLQKNNRILSYSKSKMKR